MTTARTELPRPNIATSLLGGSNVTAISNSVDGNSLVIVAYISMNHPFVTEHAFPWRGFSCCWLSSRYTFKCSCYFQRRYLKVTSINEMS